MIVDPKITKDQIASYLKQMKDLKDNVDIMMVELDEQKQGAAMRKLLDAFRVVMPDDPELENYENWIKALEQENR